MAYTAIDDPSSVFQTHLYNGSNSDITATFSGNSDLQPDWIWFKSRSSDNDHLTYDSVRGVGKRLQPNATDAEVDRSSNNDELKSFNTNGWTLGTYNSNITGAGKTCVSWNWKKVAGMFDIVAYTGNDTTRTISHSLGVIPKMIWVKERANANSWHVYNETLGNTKHLYLNTTHAAQTSSAMWNNTSPTSSVFTVSGETQVNRDGGTIIAYLFGDKQGVSKVGSYTGNGNADGTFVYLGFRPAWVMVKTTTDAGYNWVIYDNKRVGFNPDNDTLTANETRAEQTTGFGHIDMVSNGFKIRASTNDTNRSGNVFIYMAFAESPLVTSTGVPTTAR